MSHFNYKAIVCSSISRWNEEKEQVERYSTPRSLRLPKRFTRDHSGNGFQTSSSSMILQGNFEFFQMPIDSPRSGV